MYRHPALVLVAYLIAGLILGRFFPLPAGVIFAALSLLILFYIRAFFIQVKSKKPTIKLTPPPSGQLLFLGIFLIGFYLQNRIVHEEQTAEKQLTEIEKFMSVKIIGKVAGLPDYRQRNILIPVGDITVEKDEKFWRLAGKLQLVISGRVKDKFPQGSFTLGDSVEIKGKLKRPATRTNPLVFNYTAYLRQKGIYALVGVYAPGSLRIAPAPRGRTLFNQWLLIVERIRGYAEEKIFRQFSPQQAPLIFALIFGNSHNMPPQERRKYMDAGLTHLFSVSGLHTGLVALMLFLFILTITGNLRLTIILTISGLAFYTALVGFRTPVMRAAFMADVYLLSLLLLRRPIKGFDALATSAFFILLANPRALFQADFQMSYLAVFAIFMLKPVLQELFYFHPTEFSQHRKVVGFLNRYVLDPVQVVIAVQLFLLPILVYYYHRFPLVGFISNVVAVPITFFIILFGGIFLICSVFLPLFVPIFAFLTAFSAECLRFFTHLFAGLPYAAIYMKELPWWAIAIYYMLLLGGSYIQGLRTPIARLRGKAQFVVVVCALFGLLVWLPIFQRSERLLYAFFLDVGQGDSIYLEFPNDNNLLIDGGRNFPSDMGEKVIAPFLFARGVDELNAVVATHPDADHIGGLIYILENFFVETLMESGSAAETKTFKLLLQAARETGTPVVKVKRSDELKGFSPARVLVLNPSPESLGRFGTNNDSIVLRIQYNKVAFLFTGDAEELAERSIANSEQEVKADVLKAGHHGSRSSTSTAFLERVSPKVVVFSCGKDNRYGHPHPEVLERCRERGIKYYRTDEQGCITITTNGRSLRLQTEK